VKFVKSLFGDESDILTERNFQLLLVANIFSPLGVVVVSPILDSLIEPFGTTPADIGLMMSVYTAPAILLIPVVGVLADRYGRKPVLITAMCLYGTAGSLIALTTDFKIVLGLRLLQGIGFGGLTPIIITSIGDIYEGDREATGQGIRFTGSGISSTIFPLIAGGLVILAWQLPFLLFGVAIPVALVLFLWLNEPMNAATEEDDDSKEGVVTDGGSMGVQLRALYSLVEQRRVFAMVIARGLPMLIWIGFLTYSSIVVVRVQGGTSTQAGIIVALASIAYAAAASQAGRITTRFDSRFYPLVGANACFGIGFVVFVVAPILPLAGFGVLLLGTGFGVLLSLYRSIITGLADELLRGGLVSLAEAFGRVTSTLAPIIMGGIIALTSPHVALGSAIQIAGITVAATTTLSGVACLVVARRSSSTDRLSA